MKSYSLLILLPLLNIIIYTNQLESEWWIKSNAIDLTSSNFMEEISKPSQFTIVKFYTTWCKYCKQLHEVYDKVAEDIKKYINDEVKVVLSRVECDANTDIPMMYGIYSYPVVAMFYQGQPLSQFQSTRNVSFMMFWIRKSLPYMKYDVKVGEINENTLDSIRDGSINSDNNDNNEIDNEENEEIELTKEEVDMINTQLKALEVKVIEKEAVLEELLLQRREYSYWIIYILLFIFIMFAFVILVYIVIRGFKNKEKSI